MDNEQCVFCGKQATKLCDFPLGYPPEFCGHTPKSLCAYDAERNEIHSEILTRCSRPICDDCATEHNGMDFCPHCISQLKNIIIKRSNKEHELKQKKKLQKNTKILWRR